MSTSVFTQRAVIGGISIGALAGAIILVGGCYLCFCRRRQSDAIAPAESGDASAAPKRDGEEDESAAADGGGAPSTSTDRDNHNCADAEQRPRGDQRFVPRPRQRETGTAAAQLHRTQQNGVLPPTTDPPATMGGTGTTVNHQRAGSEADRRAGDNALHLSTSLPTLPAGGSSDKLLSLNQHSLPRSNVTRLNPPPQPRVQH